MLYETEGIVLSQTALGEHDKIITVLTRKEGVVRAVVKGVRKATSKLSSVTQPFSEATFQFYKGKSLDRVTQVSLRSSHPGVIADYRKTVYASYLAELTMELMPDRQSQESQYDLWVKALLCFEDKDDPWIVAKWGEMGLLLRAGLGPSLDHCTVCGGSIQEASRGVTSKTLGQQPNLEFSVSFGGIVCHSCSGQVMPGYRGMKVAPGTLRTLEILMDSASELRCPNIVARGQVRDETDLVLRQYVEYTLGKRLKSLSLVESIGADPAK
ncbi:MAG: DNA repair protein RecO [Bacillota bacterium]